MKNFIIYFHYIFFFIFIKKSIQSYIVFPFKKSTKEIKSFPDNYLQNDIEITLKVGNPPQSIDVNLRSKAIISFITSSQVKLPYPTFNESESKSLIKLMNTSSRVGNQEYSMGMKIQDSITINDKEIKDFTLILATSLAYNQSGAIGLKLISTYDYGFDVTFIYQLRNNANLDNYIYTLKYDQDNDEIGELIVGAYPHTYDKKYKEENFYSQSTGTYENMLDWVLNFDEIRYNNTFIESITRKGLLRIEYGLIQAPYKSMEFFKTNFFGKKCNTSFFYDKDIYIFRCNKNFNITEFKNLTFLIKDIDYEFVLTYKDLFIEKDNEYIFAIVFENNIFKKDPVWILGKPFMKKYNLVYDMDKKLIGLYKEKIVNNSNNNNNNTYIIYIVIIIILILIIIGLVIFIIYYLKKKRKNIANELVDDNYDYIPTN